MKLTSKQKSHLRSLAHKLKPVVMIGNAGITENVIQEIDRSLAHHELIKVRVSGLDREDRNDAANDLCQQTSSELVSIVGHIIILYRPAVKPKIQLPT